MPSCRWLRTCSVHRNLVLGKVFGLHKPGLECSGSYDGLVPCEEVSLSAPDFPSARQKEDHSLILDVADAQVSLSLPVLDLNRSIGRLARPILRIACRTVVLAITLNPTHILRGSLYAVREG